MSFTYGLDDPTPTWARGSNLALKWREDDACRAAHDESRETAHKAWKRLYNEEMPDKSTSIESVDQGDCMLWLFEGGRVLEESFDVDSIYELAEEVAILESHAAIERNEQTAAQRGHLDDDFRRTPSEIATAQPAQSAYSIDGRSLSPDQAESIEALLDAIDAGERVLVLTGAAGTGKTTSARALANELMERGWSVEYMAPTGKAAVRISEVVGHKATTIHSRLFTRVTNTEEGVPIFLDPQQLSHGRTAFICDEGSMVGRRIHDQILNHLGPNAILIYLADPYQLPPVADRWGPDLQNPTAELTQIHRQADESPILHVATLLRNGEAMPKHDIGAGYSRRNGTLETAAKWMVEQQQAGEDAIVLCYSNKTRQKINGLVRYLIGNKDRGPLCLGEQLVVLRNNKFIGRMNGETMTADKIQWLHTAKEGIVVVESGESRFFTMPNLIGADRTAFEYHSRMGDRVGADSRAWLHLDYAYCLTVHKCVHPDTLIETDNGIIPIRDAPPTGTVLTPDGWLPYRNKVTRPPGPALRIETEGGYTLTITPDHGMDAWDGSTYCRKEGEQLQIGDWLRLKVGDPWMPSFDEPILLPSISWADSRSANVQLPTHLTEDIAELFGLLVADGVLFRGGIRLVKQHEEVVARFGELCTQLFGIEPNSCEVHGTAGLELCSKTVRRWLAAVGGMSPWSKAVPDCILRASARVQARFLRGFFEDGSVNLKNDAFDHIELRQDSVALIDTVRLLLLRQGILSGTSRGKLKTPNIQIYGTHAATFTKKIGFISRLKQKRAMLASQVRGDTRNLVPILDEHVARIRALANQGHPGLTRSDANNARMRGYVTRAKAQQLPFLEEAMGWHHDKILSITPTECPSVCLEVPQGHRFFQNGFSGWNSQGSEYQRVLFVIDGTMRWLWSNGKLDDGFKLCYTAATRAREQLIVLDTK